MSASVSVRSSSNAPFDPALRGTACVLELAGGERIELPVARWHAGPDTFDETLLSRCTGPTLDIGCGPGRLVSALLERGVPTLGLDVSAVAVELTRLRGAPALRADVFGRVPAAGRWRHVLLADGNIGIGGDPVALLRRVAELLAPTGTALVELDGPGCGVRRQAARVDAEWFPWATVGVDAIGDIASDSDLDVSSSTAVDGRWFAELSRQ